MLLLENINIVLGKETKLARPVLKDLNLKVSPGEFVVIIGENGAGKSTLFNVISGSLKPDSGRVLVNDKDIMSFSHKERSLCIAKVMQDPKMGTLEKMTVLENMAYAFKRGQRLGFMPFSSKKRKQLFQEKLLSLNMGLEHRFADLVVNLSGGERQALSLVMALLVEFKILLLDEITAALDPQAAEMIVRLAHQIIRKENHTCLMITHNMRHALEYGDRTLLLKEGRFIKELKHLDKNGLQPQDLAAEFRKL